MKKIVTIFSLALLVLSFTAGGKTFAATAESSTVSSSEEISSRDLFSELVSMGIGPLDQFPLMRLLFENEIAVDRWEPVGIGEADTLAGAADAVAQLAGERLPGRFRYLTADRLIPDWHYLEIDTTGAAIETVT